MKASPSFSPAAWALWAACHHGYTRYTNDINWVCSRADETRAIHLMKSHGFEIVFEGMATRFDHLKHHDLLPVDLLWVRAETFTRMAATTQRTGKRAEMPVIDFESLIAMKLDALKDNEARHGKDMLEIRNLLGENRDVLSEAKLLEMCERFAGHDADKHVRMIS